VALLCLALAAMVKVPLAAAWALVAVWVLRRSTTREAVARIGPSALVTVVAMMVAGGRAVLEPMWAARGRTNVYTLWNLLRGGLDSVTASSVRTYPLTASPVISSLSTGSILACCLAAAVIAWRRPGRLGGVAAILVPTFAWTLLSLYTAPWAYVWLLAPAAVLAWNSWPRGALVVRARWLGLGFVCFGGLYHAASQWWIVTFATSPDRHGVDAVEAIDRGLNALHYLGLLALCVVFVWSFIPLLRADRPG
jgi:hypothetical protein